MKNLPYRLGIGVFLLNKDKKLWVGKRIDNPGNYWQMPQGGIDSEESQIQACLRELKEEIGSDNVKVIMESEEWLKYDLPDKLIGNVWKGKYRGQKQKWFACEFLGRDKDINIDYFKPEFCAWKWISPKKILDVAVPFKKKIYSTILKKFKGLY